jgi:hypothetical protein
LLKLESYVTILSDNPQGRATLVWRPISAAYLTSVVT